MLSILEILSQSFFSEGFVHHDKKTKIEKAKANESQSFFSEGFVHLHGKNRVYGYGKYVSILFFRRLCSSIELFALLLLAEKCLNPFFQKALFI